MMSVSDIRLSLLKSQHQYESSDNRFSSNFPLIAMFPGFFPFTNFSHKEMGKESKCEMFIEIMTSRLGKISKIISWYKTYE